MTDSDAVYPAILPCRPHALSCTPYINYSISFPLPSTSSPIECSTSSLPHCDYYVNIASHCHHTLSDPTPKIHQALPLPPLRSLTATKRSSKPACPLSTNTPVLNVGGVPHRNHPRSPPEREPACLLLQLRHPLSYETATHTHAIARPCPSDDAIFRDTIPVLRLRA